ncbi:SMI1/KNR4 family protein [Horticoccus luteus]|uniref:SMI1/KNR4 family protein n=1 Tax=Horticoccus luteus TaxID=2862869 RepID=A0A8F9XF57_9BACT|nr:SMI1/KNR4 family protein [Horticoccus luteus]QYM77722.1 SMI1/KNR4 family protein [Horticoccus luteus]
MGKTKMKRGQVHRAFVEQFSFPPLERPAPVTHSALLAVEESLTTTFPSSYLSFLVEHGPIFTPDILPLMVAAHEVGGSPEKEGFDVREFFPPAEIVRTYSLYVSGGMDHSLIPFAMDSGGSVFGFRREKIEVRPDDAPVLFFDHDYCQIRPEADSFDAWLEGFLGLKA